ncbi:MAG TPA: formate hydrogenlyase complex iron-sulfur subunit [Thermaerobacter sp.]
MLKLLKKVVQVGEVTTRYPQQRVEVAPGFRGKPVYDFSRCVACGACATACPPNAITLQQDRERGVATWQLDYGRCIFCGRCEEVCPTGAIQLSDDFELASLSRDDLFSTAEIQLMQCETCQQYFAPGREVQYVRARLGGAGLSENGRWLQVLRQCPRCRRRRTARIIPHLAYGPRGGKGGKRA